MDRIDPVEGNLGTDFVPWAFSAPWAFSGPQGYEPTVPLGGTVACIYQLSMLMFRPLPRLFFTRPGFGVRTRRRFFLGRRLWMRWDFTVEHGARGSALPQILFLLRLEGPAGVSLQCRLFNRKR